MNCPHCNKPLVKLANGMHVFTIVDGQRLHPTCALNFKKARK